jgi:hypothetical protein
LTDCEQALPAFHLLEILLQFLVHHRQPGRRPLDVLALLSVTIGEDPGQ